LLGNQFVNPDLVMDEPQKNDAELEDQKSDDVKDEEEGQKTEEKTEVNFT
jgi:hypothetical protein